MGLHSILSDQVQYNMHTTLWYRHKVGTAWQEPSCSVYSLESCIAKVKVFLASTRLAGTFDLLVYTDAASDVPTEWEDSDPRFIQNAADVKLRSFTTKVRVLYHPNAGCLMILFAAALTRVDCLRLVTIQPLHLDCIVTSLDFYC